MRKALWIPVVLALLVAAAPAWAEKSLVVVELYTSEGCDSCPPADEMLKQLVRESPSDTVLFIPLAFHVDYWDHLGWTDPFASPENGTRQKTYNRLLSPTRTYTPQAIINGAWETVGSSQKQLPLLLAKAAAEPVPVTVAITGARPVDGGWDVDYTASGELKNLLVFAAVTESGLESKITAGENDGMLLVHDDVVRGFTETAAAATATLHVAAPRGDPARTHLVVLAEDKVSLHVVGGARRAASELAKPATGSTGD